MMKSYVITPAAGKRLIARAVARHPAVEQALQGNRVVIVAGTTNGCVAEEILRNLGRDGEFDRRRFFRGITLPPKRPTSKQGRLPDESGFPGDVVIVKGEWQPGKTIFDVVEDLEEGDVIVKGANALDLSRKRAGILIAHPRGGTIGVGLQAVIGRRVRLLVPVGLEKRVNVDLDRIAALLNAPGTQGPRFCPVPGEVITELEAVSLLTGARAELVAGGGVSGAEGSVWLCVSGDGEQEEMVRELLEGILGEPPFVL